MSANEYKKALIASFLRVLEFNSLSIWLDFIICGSFFETILGLLFSLKKFRCIQFSNVIFINFGWHITLIVKLK